MMAIDQVAWQDCIRLIDICVPHYLNMRFSLTEPPDLKVTSHGTLVPSSTFVFLPV